MNKKKIYHLFEGYGIELEYMIVDKQSLNVLPISDKLFHHVVQEYTNDVERGEYGWSNELVLHVIEIKNQAPAASFDSLDTSFQLEIETVNRGLQTFNACLMPTAMHPWMDPRKETRLWPHENKKIYETFDRIFDCHQHGWANLQSCQINLPFDSDDEFVRLHAAIRFLMPLMPALTASSPIVEEKKTDFLDNRLQAYRNNCVRVPSITGNVIPEKIGGMEQYKKQILETIYKDVSVHDPQRTLAYEWLNARGAITRFDRNAIEIRLLDMQETPRADIAILQAIVAILKKLTAGEILNLSQLKDWPDKPLEQILKKTIVLADLALIEDKAYLKAWGLAENKKITAGEMWGSLLKKYVHPKTSKEKKRISLVKKILEKGVLSRRILAAIDNDFSHEKIHSVYQELTDCLCYEKLFRIDNA